MTCDKACGGILSWLGFVVNKDKPLWVPTQNMTWLGVNLDLQNEKFTISEERMVSIFQSLE